MSGDPLRLEWVLNWGDPICEKCGATGEVHYSCAAGAVTCLDCHAKVAPPMSAKARRWKAPPPPKPAPAPAPGTYAWLVRRVWRALEQRTGFAPIYPSVGRLDSFCPVCLAGTVTVLFIDPPHGPAELELAPCSIGCTPEQIRAAL
jgi:hypothetical protein